jgi:hypothetical protein
MIKVEISKSIIKPIIATVGASIFVCTLALPAFALPTTRVSNASGAGIVIPNVRNYDRTAPLAGQQYAGEEDENEVQPYGREDSEHERHEEMEREGREELHHMGEEGEEHAERLKNHVEEEQAEHERHEMEEHNPYLEHGDDND